MSRIRGLFGGLMTLTLMTLGMSVYLGSGAAWAQTQPLEPPPDTGQLPAPTAPVQVIHYAAPAWQFVLVGVGAVCLTLATILVANHLRHTRLATGRA